MARADDGDGFVGGEVGEGFLEGACEMSKRRAGRDSQNGFAETEDTVGRGFEGLSGGIVSAPSDDHLQWMIRKERRREAVGGCEGSARRR